MLLKNLIKTNAIKVPWPICINDYIVKDTDMKISETCIKKCGAIPKCLSMPQESGEKTCEYGLSTYRFTIENDNILIYGIRGDHNTTKFNSYNKAGIKGRSVTYSDATKWIASVSQLMEQIEKSFIARQSEMLDPLHDPIRLARQVMAISNKLVQQESRGNSFSDQVENASYELKALVKASELLCDSFELLTIYFNPEAASFGRTSPISIHSLLMKIINILRIDSSHGNGQPPIHLKGECYRNINVYDSFKLVPFALITNAVKYTLSGNIDVTISDRNPIIEVSVESIGPLIETNELKKIFEKRERGKWALKIGDGTNVGRGVGLYLAKIIADAHGFEINVSSNPTGKYHIDIPLASNRFYFKINPLQEF